MTEAPAAPRTPPGKRISLVLAVMMHVLLVIFLIYGISWRTDPPEVVQVELVSAVPPAPTSAPVPEPRPEPKLEPKPVPAPKPPPKPEIAQKEKPKPEPKPEPKPAPPKPAPDPFQEQLKREAEQLEKLKAVKAATQEHENLKAQQASAAQASDMSKYIAAISGKVRGNLVMPPDIRGNPEAVFEVTQLPSGEVLNVRLAKTSGHSAYDAATERAIRKSSPLPKPAKTELFSRTLELKFRPQDN